MLSLVFGIIAGRITYADFLIQRAVDGLTIVNVRPLYVSFAVELLHVCSH